MAANVRIQGLDKILALMNQLPKRVQTELLKELKVAADEIANLAKRDAPKDQGRLTNSISVAKIQDGYQDVAQTSYAPYLEFGTKGNAVIPAGLEQVAARYRGRGDSTGDPLKMIEEWVKRKGIAGRYSVKTRRRLGSVANKEKENRRVAFLIWRKIKRYGIKPKPFFFKQIDVVEPKLRQRVANIIQEII